MLSFLFALTASADTLTVCASGCDYTHGYYASLDAEDGDIIEYGTNFDGTAVWLQQYMSIAHDITVRSADGVRAELHGFEGQTILSVQSEGELTIENIDLVSWGCTALINRGVTNATRLGVLDGDATGITNAGEMNLYQSEIAWNVGGELVGGIYNYQDLYLYQTRIHHNEGGVGGIFNRYGGTVVMEYSQLTENHGVGSTESRAVGGYYNGDIYDNLGATFDEGETSFIYGNSTDTGLWERCDGYGVDRTVCVSGWVDPGYPGK